jgi:hypothetical protein
MSREFEGISHISLTLINIVINLSWLISYIFYFILIIKYYFLYEK